MPVVNYLWNPLNDNIVREFDDAGTVIAEYTTEANQFGNVVSQRRNSQDSVYHYDGQGSTLALTGANGDVTDTYAYSAFGEETARTGSTLNPFQYIGQKQYYRDAENAEYNVRRRDFRPITSRWLSVDPAESVDVTSQFTYVYNAPTKFTDSTGLEGEPAVTLPRPSCRAIIIVLPEPCTTRVWTPEDCPDCKCSETKSNDQLAQKACDRLMLEMCKAADALACNKIILGKFSCRKSCGGPGGFAITCGRDTAGGKRRLSVCMPTAYSECGTRALIAHEFEHVKEHIRAVCRGQGEDPLSVDYDRRASEKNAYTVQCTMLADQQCLTGEAKANEIQRCVNNLLEGSLNPVNVDIFDRACRVQNKG